MIYVNTKTKAEWLSKELTKKDFMVGCIHADLNQQTRNIIMKEFRSAACRILVSTDLLSRGIDVQQCSLVVNYDIPQEKQSYIHRIGRAGRFGRKGTAINLVTKRNIEFLKELEQH